MRESDTAMEAIVSLCKRRGFVYQGSEIYGGLAGTYDYGPLGVELKNNIKNEWWKRFVLERDDIYGVDAAILMNARTWDASGHTGAGFCDPMVEDIENRKRYRADHLLEEHGVENTEALSEEEMTHIIREQGIKSPDGNEFSDVRRFNMMFETRSGSVEDSASFVYLRPETAQGIFVNFKNVVDSFHPKLPFGIAQIGKAFRNEITPRDFIFRLRELEQMEIEYFIKEPEWEEQFDVWHQAMKEWIEYVGIDSKSVTELDVPEVDRAHYSKKTIDFEFAFPFGTKELYGLAYRTDYDLKNHMEHSRVDLQYVEARGTKLIPHVIEPTFGIDRTVLAVLVSCYKEDDMDGETRIYLKLPKYIAPYRAMVAPLLKNKPELVDKAREVYDTLKKEIPNITWDDNGNIGKRYRRQDEIGTPRCVTIDFETLEDNTVTVRERDSGKQERISVHDLLSKL